MENICNGHNGAVRIPCDECSLPNQPIEEQCKCGMECLSCKKDGANKCIQECEESFVIDSGTTIDGAIEYEIGYDPNIMKKI